MNKNLIEFHLNELEEAVTFQIVDQSDTITNYLKRVGTHYAPGFQVRIDKEPEIDFDKKMIFLRGSRGHKDLKVCKVTGLGNAKQVSKTANAIQKALEDVCKAAKGEKNKRPFIFADTYVVDLSKFDMYAELRRDPRIIIING